MCTNLQRVRRRLCLGFGLDGLDFENRVEGLEGECLRMTDRRRGSLVVVLYQRG